VDEASRYLKRAIPSRVKMGIVLGSGLGGVRRAFETVRVFPYGEIPHFPVSTVKGHRGQLVLGKRRKHRVLIMEGRVHRYEGYSVSRVTFPIRVLRNLGVSVMVITNASGSVSDRFKPGDIMLIEDHIDLMWKGVHGLSRGPQAVRSRFCSQSRRGRCYNVDDT
jgi:purine-nucleoside phosphorylase